MTEKSHEEIIELLNNKENIINFEFFKDRFVIHLNGGEMVEIEAEWDCGIFMTCRK